MYFYFLILICNNYGSNQKQLFFPLYNIQTSKYKFLRWHKNKKKNIIIETNIKYHFSLWYYLCIGLTCLYFFCKFIDINIKSQEISIMDEAVIDNIGEIISSNKKTSIIYKESNNEQGVNSNTAFFIKTIIDNVKDEIFRIANDNINQIDKINIDYTCIQEVYENNIVNFDVQKLLELFFYHNYINIPTSFNNFLERKSYCKKKFQIMDSNQNTATIDIWKKDIATKKTVIQCGARDQYKTSNFANELCILYALIFDQIKKQIGANQDFLFTITKNKQIYFIIKDNQIPRKNVALSYFEVNNNGVFKKRSNLCSCLSITTNLILLINQFFQEGKKKKNQTLFRNLAYKIKYNLAGLTIFHKVLTENHNSYITKIPIAVTEIEKQAYQYIEDLKKIFFNLYEKKNKKKSLSKNVTCLLDLETKPYYNLKKGFNKFLNEQNYITSLDIENKEQILKNQFAEYFFLLNKKENNTIIVDIAFSLHISMCKKYGNEIDAELQKFNKEDIINLKTNIPDNLIDNNIFFLQNQDMKKFLFKYTYLFFDFLKTPINDLKEKNEILEYTTAIKIFLTNNDHEKIKNDFTSFYAQKRKNISINRVNMIFNLYIFLQDRSSIQILRKLIKFYTESDINTQEKFLQIEDVILFLKQNNRSFAEQKKKEQCEILKDLHYLFYYVKENELNPNVIKYMKDMGITNIMYNASLDYYNITLLTNQKNVYDILFAEIEKEFNLQIPEKIDDNDDVAFEDCLLDIEKYCTVLTTLVRLDTRGDMLLDEMPYLFYLELPMILFKENFILPEMRFLPEMRWVEGFHQNYPLYYILPIFSNLHTTNYSNIHYFVEKYYLYSDENQNDQYQKELKDQIINLQKFYKKKQYNDMVNILNFYKWQKISPNQVYFN
jgi:hypothetical protein